AMLVNLRQVVTSQLMRVEIVREASEAPAPQASLGQAHHIDASTGEDEFEHGDVMVASQPVRTVAAEERNPADPSTWGRVGRNEPCPCGSGKKFKHCHGAFA